MVYLIFAVVYFLSAILWWKYVNLAFSKNGLWYNQTPTKTEIILMLLPLFNTIACITGYSCYYPTKNKIRKPFNYIKFFKIKK